MCRLQLWQPMEFLRSSAPLTPDVSNQIGRNDSDRFSFLSRSGVAMGITRKATEISVNTLCYIETVVSIS